jgi:hypothetical protein
VVSRICVQCDQEFKPSSAHKKCPRCRSNAPERYDLCACGERKRKASAACTSCAKFTGTNNGNWKGGKTRHKKGYVMVWAPNHPRATPSCKYVFEHILVMEDHLGRHLLPDENVHHRYGVKDDNRIENLELWVKPQPAGIRAADALAWAKEIIARYPDGDVTINVSAAE